MTEAFPPGEFIFEELAARGWTVRDLAERMGGNVAMNELVVSMLLFVRAKGMLIDDSTARQLGAAFGTSPEYWLKLDAAWQQAPVEYITTGGSDDGKRG